MQIQGKIERYHRSMKNVVKLAQSYPGFSSGGTKKGVRTDGAHPLLLRLLEVT